MFKEKVATREKIVVDPSPDYVPPAEAAETAAAAEGKPEATPEAKPEAKHRVVMQEGGGVYDGTSGNLTPSYDGGASPAGGAGEEVPRETTKPRDESLMGRLEEEDDDAGQVV